MQFDEAICLAFTLPRNETGCLSKTNIGNNFDGHYALNKIIIVKIPKKVSHISRTVDLNFSSQQKATNQRFNGIRLFVIFRNPD